MVTETNTFDRLDIFPVSCAKRFEIVNVQVSYSFAEVEVHSSELALKKGRGLMTMVIFRPHFLSLILFDDHQHFSDSIQTTFLYI